MNESKDKKYWFVAKSYGYGWGEATCWQGWAVYGAYMVLAPVGTVLASKWSEWAAVAVMVLLTLAVAAVCYAKGEPARWRWGGKTMNDDSAKSGKMPIVLHLFLGPLLLVITLWFRLNPPAEINGTCGYRTALSMSGPEIWAEAQVVSANLLIAAAVLTILWQFVSLRLMRPPISMLTSIAFMTVALLLTVPITEWHLKKDFDGQGRRVEHVPRAP